MTTGLDCGNCPPMVLAVLERRVRKDLQAVRALKAFSSVLNDAFQAIGQDVIDKLKEIVDAIPDPIVFDFNILVDFIACPLTPLALFADPNLDPTKLDPRVLLERAKETVNDYVRYIREQFERALSEFVGARIVSVMRNYENALTEFDINAISVAESTLLASTVMAVCGSDQQGSVFEQFLDELSDWSMSVIPSDLEGPFADVMSELMRAQTKFAGWTAAGAAI